tara:strand:- start:324 stop:539 length:216 start_codon:yes stop_codon:yes gene_type:complete
MSTRKTICITKNAHLYEDLSEETNVYIEIEDVGECSLELWTIDEVTTSRAVIKISKEDFQKMIDAYQSDQD